MQTMRDSRQAEAQFLAYASGYDTTDVKIKLKVDHTFRVEALCGKIAGSLGLNERDCGIARMAGLLHDIGRFEQLRRYHTFRDGVSVNHAQLSADILFQDGLIDRFVPAPETDGRTIPGTEPGGRSVQKEREEYEEELRLLELSIRFHNAYRLPDALSDRERMFCQILRDADKVDILRVNTDTPMTEIYDMPEEAFLTAEISDEVYEDMLAHRDVNRAHTHTAIDFLMGHIAFVFGLVYPESLRLMREQGYLENMLHFESRNGQTRQRMERIREEVHAYMEKRESEAFATASSHAGSGL